MRSRLALTVLLALMLFAAACSGGDGEASTTTSADGGTVTSLGAAGGGDGGSGSTGSTVAPGADVTTTRVAGAPVIPTFEILEREPGDEGDTVVVLLDPASYESLTDIDLQNVIAEVVDAYAPVSTVHVIDDERVAPLLGRTDLTPEEQRLVDNYYLVRLDDGFRITFEGPFADIASTVLGS